MPIGCHRAACETRCTVDGATAAPPRTVAQQTCRLAPALLAILAGSVLIQLATIGTRPGRFHRGTWAKTRASRMVLHGRGIRLEVDGAPRSGAGLIAGNHVSWLDVLALSSCGAMREVAKREVGDWPLIGLLSRRAGGLEIHRESWYGLPDLVDRIATALRQGHRVQVFPEGTTRCGGALNPFRRAAFQAAIDAAVVVMPVTVAYVDRNGVATAAPAFVGRQTLAASFRRVLGVDDLTIRVHWLPAIPAIAGTGRPAVDRARVARLAETAVAADLGRPVLHRPARAWPTAARAVPINGGRPGRAQVLRPPAA